MLLRDRVEERDHVEARLAAEAVDAGEIDEHVEVARGILFEEARDRDPGIGADARPLVAVLVAGLEDFARGERLVQTIEDDLCHEDDVSA